MNSPLLFGVGVERHLSALNFLAFCPLEFILKGVEAIFFPVGYIAVLFH
jgi:hypothetical protein